MITQITLTIEISDKADRYLLTDLESALSDAAWMVERETAANPYRGSVKLLDIESR